MRKTLWRMNIAAAAIALAYLGYVFLGRNMPPPEPGSRRARAVEAYRDFFGIDKATGVRILQYYASAFELREGDHAVICYGVVNAKSVRIEPGYPQLTTSLNRCVEARPDDDTRYTITVIGSDGKTLTQALDIRVQPDPAMHPKIAYFRRGARHNDRGRTVQSLCYAANNADRVEIDPPVMPPTTAPKGCFYVAPRATTTYTLTVTGPKGRKAREQVTVPLG